MEKRLEPSTRADELANQVIGAAIEVHKCLGPGFPESVYRESLVHELGLRGISVVREAAIEVQYKGVRVGQGRIDIFVENELVVELKTVETINDVHVGQVLSYLKAAGKVLGLIINFKTAAIRGAAIKRVVCSG
jgi:GxxExxY protein